MIANAIDLQATCAITSKSPGPCDVARALAGVPSTEVKYLEEVGTIEAKSTRLWETGSYPSDWYFET